MGKGAHVDLVSAQILGGTLKTSGANSMIDAVAGTLNLVSGSTIASGSLGSAAQVRAADCSINVNACISGNQGKPNAVAKCQLPAKDVRKPAFMSVPSMDKLTRPANVGAGAAGPDQRECLESNGPPHGRPLNFSLWFVS